MKLSVISDVLNCRSCGSPGLLPVLDLGSTPIANALVAIGTPPPDPSYSLTIVFCSACGLVQLGRSLPSDAIFTADYPYYSSFSDSLVSHARHHVDTLVARLGLGPGSLAVEVASNDGYLLRHFIPHGVQVLGVDPSPSPAAAAERLGVPTRVEFFGTETARDIRDKHGAADVVLANNVMAHVPDLNDFVRGLATLVSDEGVVTIENPSVQDLIQQVQFDTIYHEHYCYFSCLSVESLLRRHGLHLNDVEYFPGLHGGSFRWWAGRSPNRTARCAQRLDSERALGLDGHAFYLSLAADVERCRGQLTDMIAGLRAQGATIAAYGAAAKGATLVNTFAITSDDIEFVVDRNTYKQGRAMPGCRIPILAVEAIIERRPDYVLLLAWNFAEEILGQQREYRDAGGKFILPVPEPRIV